MNNKDLFKVNNRVEIEREDGYYKSIIQDIKDDSLYISIPVSEGSYLPLHENEQITGLYFNGRDILKFTTIVTGRKIDKILMLKIKRPESYKKVQRRSFVRINVLLDTCCACMNKTKELKDITKGQFNGNLDIEFFNATILDLSGGGAKLSSKRELFLGEIIIMSIPFDEETITLKSKIVRKEKDDNNVTVYGIKFIEVDDRNREKIIRFIFMTMRKQLHRS
ncbi:flagellar brake protein [Clostridium oceanicum]|uniref:Flagellar brake domain-containing protein n=1 Tax=Clostridium oceanicum TaxID=1543 RepID=A0ABP3V0U9_9CLOT